MNLSPAVIIPDLEFSKDFFVVKCGKILELRGLKEWEGYFAMVGLKEFSHIHVWVCSIA